MTTTANRMVAAPLVDGLGDSGRPKFEPSHFAHLGQSLFPAKTLSSLFRETLDLVLSTLNTDFCEILEHVPRSNGFVCRGMAAISQLSVSEPMAEPELNPLALSAVVCNEPVIMEDLQSQSRSPHPAGLREFEIVSSCSIPIPGRARPYGVLAIHSTTRRCFEPNEISLLQSVANGLGTAIDLHQTEKKLQESEERFRTIFAGGGVGMVLFDIEFRLVNVNEVFCNLMGSTEQELNGTPLCALAHPEDADVCLKAARQLVQGEVESFTVEQRYLKKPKEVIWIHLTASAIKDKLGQFLYGLAIIENITEATRARRKLERQTTYLKALYEHSPQGIIVLDPHHRVRFCNPAFERLFQYKQEEMIGTRLDEMIADEHRMAEAAELTRLVQAGERTYAETRRCRKDGTLVDVEIFGVPLLVDGKQIGIYGLYQDISVRKQAERSLQHLSGRLLSLQDDERRRIARELHDSTGQSLAALSMYLSVVSKSQSALGRIAQKALVESLALADQCSREIRTVSYLLHPPLLDELGLLSALRWYVTGFSQRSKVEVDLDIPQELKRLPSVVETTLFRIVQEALTNIHRHSRSKAAAIRLEIQGNVVVLEIRDEGRGIPKSVLKEGNSSPSKLGVGIPGMRERTKQLGGRMEISSSSRGTLIRVALPIRGRNHGVTSHSRS